MKVICVLQNAWGSGKLPKWFCPNPFNKSAKTIRNKVLAVGDIMHFCNTTHEVTSTAKDRAEIDKDYFKLVISGFDVYDLVLVCGNQAAKAIGDEMDIILKLNKPIIFMPHPASRTLSNIQLAEVKAKVDKYRV